MSNSTAAMMLLLFAAMQPNAGAQQSQKPACLSDLATSRAELAKAMAERDRARIDREIRILTCHLASAPPERPERYAPFPPRGAVLKSEQRASAIRSLWDEVARREWWRRAGRKPEALRIVAEVVQASLAQWRVGGPNQAADLERARRAGDYLLDVQREAGSGVLGFPLEAAPGSEAESLGKRFVSAARSHGILDQVTHGGWIIDDLGNGDLYYDNGLAGQALLALFQATDDARYLDAARRAGDWSVGRPIVPNFNYNGFTVALLSDLYATTHDTRYLDEALTRADLGVLSGQLSGGAQDGSWLDPHNKRLVYRYIMIGQLGELLAALPPDHEARPRIITATHRALAAVERQQKAAGGGGNLNSAVVTYCKLLRLSSELRTIIAVPSEIQNRIFAFTAKSLLDGKPKAGLAAVACYLERSALGLN